MTDQVEAMTSEQVVDQARAAFDRHVMARALVQRAVRQLAEVQAAMVEAEDAAAEARSEMDFWVSALIERGLY